MKTTTKNNDLLELQEFQLLEGNLEMNNAIRAQKKQIIRDKAVALLYKEWKAHRN